MGAGRRGGLVSLSRQSPWATTREKMGRHGWGLNRDENNKKKSRHGGRGDAWAGEMKMENKAKRIGQGGNYKANRGHPKPGLPLREGLNKMT